MDIDSAKENIQPLAGGRNIGLLQFALNAEKRQKEHDELLARRREYEEQIKTYEGEDPLELWLEYIHWIEQAFPRSGKESEFQDALQRCLQLFEHEDKYKQDVRMVKMYIKFIDSQPQTNRHEYFSFLFHQGIGTMVADLYLAWAYYFEAVGSFEKADEIYKMGVGARAQPLDRLQQAQAQLYRMAAEGVRCRDDEEYNQKLLAHIGERRFALTSLHGQTKKKVVGSLRTDAAVKSRTPGLVLQENVQSTSNVGPVQVLADGPAEEESLGLASASTAAQIKSVIDTAIKAQENICEPGPWSKSKSSGGVQKKGSLFSKKEIATNPGFEICEDSLEGDKVAADDDSGSLAPAIQLPSDFIRNNEPQEGWQVPLTIPEETKAVPAYAKKFVYPPSQEDKEYSIEEMLAYRRWARKIVRPAHVRVLEEMDSFMGAINLPENFIARNLPQTPFEPERYAFGPEDKGQPMCRVLSVSGCQLTYEDLLKEKYLAARKRRQEEAIVAQQKPVVENNSVEMELEDMEVEAVVQQQQQQQQPESQQDRLSASPPSDSPFGFNDTCSTQMFNLFIKPQSISTPNRGKGQPRDKPPAGVPRSSLSLYKASAQSSQMPREDVILESSIEEQQATKVGFTLASSSSSSAAAHQPPSKGTPSQPQQNTSPDAVHYGGAKQLSVIMETTESSASSGGCQTATDATITNTNHTKSTSSSSTSSSCTSTIDYGVLSLTAKPRKSILKQQRPDCSTAVEPFTIFQDECEVGGGEKTSAPTVKRDENSFAMPQIPEAKPSNIPIFRDSMDFFGGAAPRPPTVNVTTGPSEFAMPLPPKPKTFLPLYNDSMEHFMEKAKTVPRIPIIAEPESEMSLFAGDAIFSKIGSPTVTEQPSKVVPDFSIFHDSMLGGAGKEKMSVCSYSSGAIPKDKSLLGMSSKENKEPQNVSLSPLKSFMHSQQQHQMQQRSTGHNNTDDSESFLDSPQHKKGSGVGRSKEAIYATSTESTMPTIAAIDPLLLENSMTFPSMKDITAHTTIGVRKLNEQSISSKMQQQQQSMMMMPPLLMEESMTFNTLMKETGNKSKASAFNPNLSILDLQKELVINDGDDDVEEKAAAGPPPPSQLFEESMTFNSLMRKEAKGGLPAIVAGVGNLSFGNTKAEPTTTANIPKPKLLNDSITFNSLIKREMGGGAAEDDDLLFLKPPNPNQSTFAMELPSSTAHGFSIFTHQKALGAGGGAFPKHDDDGDDHYRLRMEKSISPIPSIRHEEEVDEMLEEEQPETEEGDIYKWENTLRVLPEVDEPDPDSWYNVNLDGTVDKERHQRSTTTTPAKNAQEQQQRKRRIGDEEYVDPFDPDLINNFLATVDFVNYVHKLNECDMREKIPPLRQGGQLEVCDQLFSVRKLIGKGAFGQIYSAKTTEGRLVALKQSRPCNLWEYYICMEVKFRLKEFNEDLLPALIDIEYALVAKNASVFVVPFCGYGNLINVCNEVKRETGRNLHEKVVMVLVTQLLTIIDALHACQIIHADIKPDNLMLMGPIETANYDRPVLKLIDFGQAIDMQLFPPHVEFSSSLATEGFTCSEMLEQRPWTYQTDLFCVAGTIHTLLLGKYMSVQKGVCGYSVAKFPRYLQKAIWDEIFEHLLNVTDCRTMPNLQEMKLLLKQHLADHDTSTLDEVRKFNQVVQRIQVLDK